MIQNWFVTSALLHFMDIENCLSPCSLTGIEFAGRLMNSPSTSRQ